MTSVEQVKPDKTDSYTKDYYRTSQPDSFMGFEDLGAKSSEAPNLTTEEPSNNFESRFSWGGNDSKPYRSEKDDNDSSRSRIKHTQPVAESSGYDDMKKFQGAKGISSDQLFGTDQGNQSSDRLDQYRGSNAISSDELFGEKKKPGARTVDYQSMKDSVSNVTGKLSTMASGVIGSLQSRYSGNN